MANRAAVARLTSQLGSRIPETQLDGYVHLMRSTKHISAALQMMANWDLPSFSKRLTRLNTRVDLVSSSKDFAVPPSQADQLVELLPNARIHRLTQLGHLAHEEAPHRVAELILEITKLAGQSPRC